MKKHQLPGLFYLLGLLLLTHPIWAQSQPESAPFFYGDPLPDAPELAARGPFQVGVRTLTIIHPGQPDVAKAANGTFPIYDRPLNLEIWYPAELPDAKLAVATYTDVLGSPNDEKRPLMPFTFPGRALRDAAPHLDDQPYPLIIVSHGYPGSRYLMTYLTENLASKGYVVVAIDHTESTHRDRGPFASTLLHRPLDILFVLDEMANRSKKDSDYFLAGWVDTQNTALIGYSMGGYGVLNVGGAAYSEQLATLFKQMTGGSTAIKQRCVGAADMIAPPDERIKAIVAFAPWGMARGVWNANGLAGLRIPTFFIAGDQDDISGYEDGIKAIFEGAINVNRHMLTYLNARHNVAPNPPPAEVIGSPAYYDDFMHYAEPAWDLRRINNINQHFITAFLGIRLKGQDYDHYLEVPTSSNENAWNGFKDRTAVGLELRRAEKQ